MKKNLISALVLASLACFSTACMTSSSPDEAGDVDSNVDVGVQINDKGDNESAAQNKPGALEVMVAAPDSLPFGASYEQWAAAYWQWVMSIPVKQNPIFDGPCGEQQSGSVFFLAGNTGSSHYRSCVVPADTGIFIPLLTGLGRSCPELASSPRVCSELTSESAIREAARRPVDSSNALLTMTVDGQKIAISPEFRVETAVFADTSPENPSDRLFDSCSGPIEVNACGLAEGSDRAVVADGYFVMLSNLPPGEHRIHLAANVGPNSTEKPYEVTYTITVQ